MNAAPARRSLPRSIGAVFAGFLTVVVLSIVTDLVLHGTGVFPPEGQPMSAALWWLATAYRVAYAIAGGFVTAALAPARPTTHVVILGSLGTLMAVLGVVATWGKGPAFGPAWYPISLVVTALPATWAGGWLHAKRAAGRPGAA